MFLHVLIRATHPLSAGTRTWLVVPFVEPRRTVPHAKNASRFANDDVTEEKQHLCSSHVSDSKLESFHATSIRTIRCTKQRLLPCGSKLPNSPSVRTRARRFIFLPNPNLLFSACFRIRRMNVLQKRHRRARTRSDTRRRSFRRRSTTRRKIKKIGGRNSLGDPRRFARVSSVTVPISAVVGSKTVPAASCCRSVASKLHSSSCFVRTRASCLASGRTEWSASHAIGSKMPLYEILCMARPLSARKELVEIVSRAGNAVLSSGGIVIDVKSYGQQTLAYTIKTRSGEKMRQVRGSSAKIPDHEGPSNRPDPLFMMNPDLGTVPVRAGELLRDKICGFAKGAGCRARRFARR